jgi:ABC-2 type transport system permease protein
LGRSLSVALGLAKRTLKKLFKQPLPALPPVLIPLFMFAAFSGALSGLASTKAFKYYDFTAFEFIFVLMMASMLSAAFSSFEASHDYEQGFGSRLMLAAPRRMAILLGYVLYGFARFLITMAIVWGVALATGMDIKGGPLDIAGILGLMALLNLATMLYALGISLRLQSSAAGMLVTVPVFILLFLTPVFIPRGQLSGWLKTAADYNPLTPVIESGRGFMAKDPTRVLVAYGVTAGMLVFFALFAIRGMVKASQGPRGERGGGRGGGRRERRAERAETGGGGGRRGGGRRGGAARGGRRGRAPAS